MAEFKPTSAATWCDIVAGDINNTIDGNDYTFVQFGGGGMRCLTQWEWDNEKLLTNFFILSSGYTTQNNCHIYGIWLKINGDYEKAWEGELYLPDNAWFKIIANQLCSGLRIAQKLDGYGSKINEVYGEEQEISGCTNPTGDEGAEICGQVQHGQDSTHRYKCVNGTWVDQGYDSSCDTGEWELHKALTCLLVNGPGDPGPKVTEFDIDQTIYAYSEIQGPDMYGKVVKHEWWYKETGVSDFTKKWTYTHDPIDGHDTGYAHWSWNDIGNDYGPGEGYIKIYLDDVYMGKTNNYTISGEVIADLVVDQTVFPATAYSGKSIRIKYQVKNIGSMKGIITAATYEHPGTSDENMIDSVLVDEISPGQQVQMQTGSITVPNLPGETWPLGVKVWGETESEPSWGSMGTKIFKIQSI